MKSYPILVCKLAQLCDAWIVGSAADPNVDLNLVKDFDILVPYYRWNEAAMLIPANAKVNSFGGWKCDSNGKEVDVWPEDLGHFLTNHNGQGKYALQLRSGVRVQIEQGKI